MGVCATRNTVDISSSYHPFDDQYKPQPFRHKVLLLGTAASGKSTFLKCLQYIHADTKFNDNYVEDNITIRKQAVDGIIALISQANNLYQTYNVKDCFIRMDNKVKVHIDIILKFRDDSSFENMFNLDKWTMQSVAKSIEYIWNLSAIQSTWKYRLFGIGKYRTFDNLDYFLNKIHKIIQNNYVPTKEDMLKTRIKSTGHCQFDYEIDHRYYYNRNIVEGEIFEVIDMGGTRNERRKWYEQFDKVHGLIYFVALDDYSKVLLEDENKNAMLESLELFEQICNLRTFRKTEIILFFTKIDLFKESLKYTPLTYCFGVVTPKLILFMLKINEIEMDMVIPIDINGLIVKYCDDLFHEFDFGWSQNMDEEELDSCYTKTVDFIKDKFVELNKNQNKSIYYHLLNVTDIDYSKKVMWDVQHCLEWSSHPSSYRSGRII